ncbi:hypothetical protein Nepgr_033115 [Nepenthes gracilis]|uniref:Remorin C-terminal domain-containing protein n=1 Tax=Nepenthes gracilis TaxID=150966 RepID=A0AAD3Y6B9_NEPGR|nr:hypothetical protein Nepgr_033115 [Nepenthes gracilis]
MKRVQPWPTLFPSSTTTTSKSLVNTIPADQETGRRDSTSDTGRRCEPATWSMSSLLAVLPESPSPICSSDAGSSPNSPPDFCSFSQSHVSSELSNARNQITTHLPCLCKLSESRIERDYADANSKNKYEFEAMAGGSGKEEWVGSSMRGSMSSSTVYESAVDHREIISGSTSSAALLTEEEAVEEETAGPKQTPHPIPTPRRNRRPKPYTDFLDQLKTQQIDAQIDTWCKSKHIKLQNKLRRKDADIDAWEWREINKAKQDMKTVEKKLQEKRAKAEEKMQVRIGHVKMVSANERTRWQRLISRKMSEVAKASEKMRATKSMTWLKRMTCCWI